MVVTAGLYPVLIDPVKAFFAENASWELLRGNTAGLIFAAEEICARSATLASGNSVKRV